MAVQISRLSVEHYQTGFGLGHARPRISWSFQQSTTKNWKQTSCNVRITRNGRVGDFGFKTEQSVLVEWPDTPLASREKATVQVQVTGNDGQTSDWATLDIEAALLDSRDWKGELISCQPQPKDTTKRPFRVRRRFNVPPGSDLSTARVYATAHGLYELEINGKTVGDHVLAPGWQSYSHRLSYQTHDISALLHQGDNMIGAWVGEGWFAGRLGFGGGWRNMFGERIGLLAQVELDGHTLVSTDKDWEWSFGSIIKSEIYDGEHFDSRLQDSGWTCADKASNAEWKPVDLIGLPMVTPTAPQAPPVRRTEELNAREIIKTPSGKTVIDFGQNLVGWVRWNSPGPRCDQDGAEVIIKHAEVLEHGELGVRPLRECKAVETIILGGDLQGYEPKFTFHGFRYIEVTGWDDIQLEDLSAMVVHSDVARHGTFECSHAMLNQLYSNICWSLRGNLVSVPTDCPQRDERLGWTGDLQVIAPTASYIFGVQGLLSEWLQDVASEQLVDYDGVPPEVIPNVLQRHMQPTPLAVWADVTIITPWDLFTLSGDKQILQDQYESMRVWLDKGVLRNKAGGWGDDASARVDHLGLLWDPMRVQLGDWLDPFAPPTSAAEGKTSPHLVADVYLIRVTRLMAHISKALSLTSEAERYSRAAAHLLEAFHQEYVTPKNRLLTESQCSLALVLQFDIAKTDHQRTQWTDKLEHMVKTNHFRVGTGFAGTPIILNTLAQKITRDGPPRDKLPLAYRMIQEKACPSWLYPISMGATTMWERWDSMLPDGSINPGEMTSFNHYAFGSVARFLHEVIGGIDMSPRGQGYKTFEIQPRPGGTITWGKTSHVSPYGKIVCSWKLTGASNDRQMQVNIVVPPNTTARVVLPNQTLDRLVGSGEWEFQVPFKSDERWPPQGVTLPYTPPTEELLVE